METSLRYSGDSKALRIHAKEKIPIDSSTRLQLHAELDTMAGGPSYFCAIFRHFYPQRPLQWDCNMINVKTLDISYVGKKPFPVTSNGLLSFNIKGRCDADQEFKKKNYEGATEFSWSIFNFQKDQDVRLKVGYEMFETVPYMQIRENHWTFNADMNGRWNVRFDL